MHDPGGYLEEESMGDWAFLREEARWRPVHTEEGRRQCKPLGWREYG